MEGGKIVQWNVRDIPGPKLVSNEDGGSGAADPTAIGHQNHKTVLSNMVDVILTDHPPLVDGNEARKAVAVITAIYESSNNEKVVYL